eukprot:1599695-Amphidinium_carterae.1
MHPDRACLVLFFCMCRLVRDMMPCPGKRCGCKNRVLDLDEEGSRFRSLAVTICKAKTDNGTEKESRDNF